MERASGGDPLGPGKYRLRVNAALAEDDTALGAALAMELMEESALFDALPIGLQARLRTAALALPRDLAPRRPAENKFTSLGLRGGDVHCVTRMAFRPPNPREERAYGGPREPGNSWLCPLHTCPANWTAALGIRRG